MRKSLFIPLIITILFATHSMNMRSEITDKPEKDKSPIVTLSPSQYTKETAKGLVLVDFWAAWCGPCRRIAPILEKIAIEHKDSVKIGKLNVDNYKKFALEQGIEALPTIVVYKDGKEMTRIKGSVSKDVLEKIIKTYSAEEAN